jgi:hypothetical protein
MRIENPRHAFEVFHQVRQAELQKIRQHDDDYRDALSIWTSLRTRRHPLVFEEERYLDELEGEPDEVTRRHPLVLEEERYLDEPESEPDEATRRLHDAKRTLAFMAERFLMGCSAIPWVTGLQLVDRSTSADILISRLQEQEHLMTARHGPPLPPGPDQSSQGGPYA